MVLWIKFLLSEGKNIAKRAERAEDAGNHILAIELYIKAVAKFKQASELCEDFNEISIMRSLANYYYDRALTLEKKIRYDLVLENPSDLKPRKKETFAFDVALLLKGTGIRQSVFETVFSIAIEISHEGREGHAIGTAFVVGDAAKVMAKSRQLVFNPFEGHSRENRMITDPEIKDNIKEFAQLDGVFVVSGDGVVEATGRYITIDTGMVILQKGLGTRHSSVAAITMVTNAIGVVISQSGGIIRIFKNGKIAVTIRPFI